MNTAVMPASARERWLGAALLACAALAIASAPWALDAPVLNFVFKPMATLVVIAYARGRGDSADKAGRETRAAHGDGRDPAGAAAIAARRWVLIGLWLSLAGDVALLWPKEGFLPGLVSFLLAHLAYLVAFTRQRRLMAWWPAFAAYALVAGTILWRLWPGVPAALQAPVAAYVLCLASMAAQAAVLWRQGVARGVVLALGGALFVASDALLATNKFAGPLPLASLWILATYWAAQWCIASWLAPRGTRTGR
ncbi:MAG: lysoplasmalogenase [Rubrivivax sp.]|nr:lysoplasmalogenase [Rubrivivax sp.]